MFGEFDSESPRVPSPWDSLTPPSSPPTHNGIPKLVPEADEGNVEYKLQLLSPTPARFARLVTQLKWRLLEGGGQAYYELGVADSGTLVGLPRDQLEESLETLEMMAGEIGASVIVVKEIEVPPELSSLAHSQIERWDGRRTTRRKDLLRMAKQDGSPTTSTTEFETELSNTDITDIEETSGSSPPTSPASLGGESTLTRPRPSSNLLPFDSALTMFTMDIGEDVADYADNEAPGDDDCVDQAKLSVNLEISSVYKPRPAKKRTIHSTSSQSNHFEYGKGRLNGYPPSKSADTPHTGDTVAPDSGETHSEPMSAKAQLRRDRRDKRQGLKLSTQLLRVPIWRSTGSPTSTADSETIPSCSTDGFEPTLGPPQTVNIDPQTGGTSAATVVASQEPRLIVEALVVRKLSFDEAFLDFEGFSLQ